MMVIRIPATSLASAANWEIGDVVSEHATAGLPWTFAGMARTDGGSGVIEKSIILCETTGLVPRLTLFLYTGKPTGVLNDGITNTNIVVADTLLSVGWIDYPAMEDLGTGQSQTIAVPGNSVNNLLLPYICTGTNLYGVLVTRDAEANEVAGMRMTIIHQIRQD